MVALSNSDVFGDSAPSHPLLVDGATLFATYKASTLKKVQGTVTSDKTDSISEAVKKPSAPVSVNSLHSEKESLKAVRKKSVRNLMLQVGCRKVTGDLISLDWSSVICEKLIR